MKGWHWDPITKNLVKDDPVPIVREKIHMKLQSDGSLKIIDKKELPAGYGIEQHNLPQGGEVVLENSILFFGPTKDRVDIDTLTGKVVRGPQPWFSCTHSEAPQIRKLHAEQIKLEERRLREEAEKEAKRLVEQELLKKRIRAEYENEKMQLLRFHSDTVIALEESKKEAKKKKGFPIPAMKKEESAGENEPTCIICMDRKIKTINLPCGHMISCIECAHSLLADFVTKKQDFKCSKCKKIVTKIKEVFAE